MEEGFKDKTESPQNCTASRQVSTFKTCSKEDFNQIEEIKHSGRDKAQWERLPTESVESLSLKIV